MPVLFAGHALAEVISYPGANCVKWSGSDPSYYYSTIENPSTSTTLKVDCPMPNIYNNSPSQGFIYARDRHSGQAVTCSFINAYRSGSSIYHWSSGNDSTSGDSTTYQFLSFGSVGSAGDDHWWYYTCSIPPDESGKSSVAIYNYTQA